MRSNKIILYICLIIGFSALLVFGLLQVSNNFKSDTEGEIAVRIIDENNQIIKEKMIEFQKDDNLEDLIKSNFSGVLFVDGMLLNIEGIKTPSDYSYFFWGKINGTDFPTGAGSLEFKDKDVIELIFTKNTWNENS